MNEREFAKQCIEQAIQMKELQGMACLMLDKEECFSEDYDLKVFASECNKLGFRIVPIEQSPFKQMPLKNKLILLEK